MQEEALLQCNYDQKHKNIQIFVFIVQRISVLESIQHWRRWFLLFKALLNGSLEISNDRRSSGDNLNVRLLLSKLLQALVAQFRAVFHAQSFETEFMSHDVHENLVGQQWQRPHLEHLDRQVLQNAQHASTRDLRASTKKERVDR